MKKMVLCLATCATVVGLSSACLADDIIAAEKFEGTALSFQLKKPLSNTTLSVAGPDEFYASAFSKTGAVALDLGKYGPVEDGIYIFQITAATDQPLKVRTPLNYGRYAKQKVTLRKGVAMSGTFFVTGGKIVKPLPATKEGLQDEPKGGTVK